MKINFGILLDGTRWSLGTASAGEVQLGHSGLLGLLETRLGIRGPNINPAIRVSAYLQKLRRLDGPEQWFHGSFVADEWSTAVKLLSWRDELIVAGWDGTAPADAPSRIRVLSDLESIGPEIPEGAGDRMNLVIRKLGSTRNFGITSISLIDPLPSLPPVWRRILGLLSQSGVLITERAVPRTSGESALRRVIGAIDGEILPAGTTEPGDGSLVYLQSSSEWSAAEMLAAWLKARPSEPIAIICSKPTSDLDRALRRAGLPSIGQEDASPWRLSMQVLPLVIANCWEPFDVLALAQLLSLDYVPLSTSAVKRLKAALAKEPGTGGDAWRSAISLIQSDLEADLGRESALAESQRIDRFLASERFSPLAGISGEKLVERCSWLVDIWESDRSRFAGAGEAIQFTREFSRIVAGAGTLSRILIERILETIAGKGTRPGRSQAEATPWLVVDHPGKLTEPVNSVVWWGFGDTRISVPGFWSSAERKALKGISLEDPQLAREREISAWKNAGRLAKERLLLIGVNAESDGQQIHHPYWDEIRSAFQNAFPDSNPENCLVYRLPLRDDSTTWTLAGRSGRIERILEAPVPKLSGRVTLANPISTTISSVSYSQMETMVACPAKWVFQYHSGLRVPGIDSIPTGNQLIGNLCHRIVHEILQCEGVSGEESGRIAGELYDSLVPVMASELLLDENRLELKRLRTIVTGAVSTMVDFLRRHGLSVISTESRHERELESFMFRGIIDLVLKGPGGEVFVVDLKWTSSESHFREEIEEGEALQLASYAFLLRARDAHIGYFLLSQNRMLTSSPLVSDERIPSSKCLRDLWVQAVKAWRARLSALQEGKVEASGIMEATLAAGNSWSADRLKKELRAEAQQKGQLYRTPPCQICNYAGVCGRSGGN